MHSIIALLRSVRRIGVNASGLAVCPLDRLLRLEQITPELVGGSEVAAGGQANEEQRAQRRGRREHEHDDHLIADRHERRGARIRRRKTIDLEDRVTQISCRDRAIMSQSVRLSDRKRGLSTLTGQPPARGEAAAPSWRETRRAYSPPWATRVSWEPVSTTRPASRTMI